MIKTIGIGRIPKMCRACGRSELITRAHRADKSTGELHYSASTYYLCDECRVTLNEKIFFYRRNLKENRTAGSFSFTVGTISPCAYLGSYVDGGSRPIQSGELLEAHDFHLKDNKNYTYYVNIIR